MSTRPAAALGAAALAAMLFIGMDATVKTLAPRYDALQLTFLRFAGGALFAVPLWAWFRTPLPERSQWRWHALRSALLLLALLGWFHALKLLPLVEAVGVGYLAPLFIALLAILLLGERPSRWIWAALALGGLGAGVALWPDLAASAAAGGQAAAGAAGAAAAAAHSTRLEGMAAALASAVCYAGVVVLARHQAQRDAMWTILLVQNVLPLVILAVPVALRWTPMPLADLPMVLLIGALATGGLFCITWAFTHIEASRAAPMEYTGLVWAALLGHLLFGEVPSMHGLVSAGLIVAGALLLLKR